MEAGPIGAANFTHTHTHAHTHVNSTNSTNPNDTTNTALKHSITWYSIVRWGLFFASYLLCLSGNSFLIAKRNKAISKMTASDSKRFKPYFKAQKTILDAEKKSMCSVHFDAPQMHTLRLASKGTHEIIVCPVFLAR